MPIPEYTVTSAPFANDIPLAQAARQMQEAGFRQVEVFSRPELIDDPETTRRILADHGLSVVSVHSPVEGWDNDAWDEEVRLASIAACARCFGHAAALGASVVVIHPNTRSHPFGVENWERNGSRTRGSLALLADIAGVVGVRMAVENMPDCIGEERGTRPGVRIDDLLRLIEGLGEHVGILLDIGHCNISDTDPVAEARLAGDKLLELHLQDNEGIPGEDQHLLPGLGTVDWEALLETLDAMGYSGLRTFEAGRPKPPDELLRRLGTLRTAWRARSGGEAS